MADEKKLALLIDSDNVSAKYAQFILQEASKYGELSCKRVYGDWEKNNTGWRVPAMNNSILPVQQTCYVTGKNATDFSMIIDAMDLLYGGAVDGFVLVTSDSDFTRLAIRLREAGKLVVGIGEVKTPLAFTSSCHHFSYLNQMCDSVDDYDEKTLRHEVLEYVKENEDKRLDLGKIDSFITSKFGNVDFDMLGYKRLSNFIDSFPELRRSNTFVALKKKTPPPQPPKAAKTGMEFSAAEIEDAIIDFIMTNGEKQDNMIKLESYLNSTFGKIDYSRFGSRRFAKFIDKLTRVKRIGTSVIMNRSLDGNPLGKNEDLDIKNIEADILKYAEENMPDGGNLGQLNNMLLEKYGKNYVSELGFNDFASILSDIPGVYTSRNRVYLSKTPGASPAVKPEQKSEPRQTSKPERAETAEQAETPDSEVKAPEAEKTAEPVFEASETPDKPEKPELNAVKRDILSCAAQNDNGISLPALGKVLSEKYGKGYLKELGYSSMKKLVSEISGVNVADNRLSIDKEFLDRTDEIEQFVYDFARSEGSHSIKALSSGIKKKFPGFDFTDYGYGKFSDFINAIDGVRANGYYVEPV